MILLVLGGAFFGMPAIASTSASLSPATMSVTQGENFNIVIAVDPQGAANYAEKIELDYPADMLEVTSFTYANGWTALTSSDYDMTDNAHGVMIKTAGYPKGISSLTTFGTASFSVKKAGSGTIALGSKSVAFEINNQSAITGSSVSFTSSAVQALTPAPSAALPQGQGQTGVGTQKSNTPQTIQSTQSPSQEITPNQTGGTEASQEQASGANAGQSRSFFASVANVITFGTGNGLIAVGLLLALGALTLLLWAQFSE